MSDITIKYSSTGFEKVARELSELEKKAGGSASWFTPMQKSLKDAEGAGGSFFSSFSAGLEKLKPVLAGFASDLLKVSGLIGGLAVAVGGATVIAFEKWTMSVLKTTESFRMLEISMYGATKSWEAVATASKFAKEYAAEYPAMYGDIMRALQSFAYIPALRPMIQRGDVQNMKEMMHIVQGMMTIRPEQGVTGAIYALREALAGNWRSLMYRFDIPIASIAEAAGMTLEQMKQSPEQAVKALKAWIDEFVGAETMAMMAKNLSIQVGNLRDKYEMWLDRLGKTGVYQKVVDYLLKLNEAMDAFMQSERMAEWTERINSFLEGIVDRIASVFTEGIDWESVMSFEDLMAALKKVGDNAIKAFKDIWDSIKDPMAKALQSVFKTVSEMVMPVIKEVFYPVGKEIAKQVISGVYDFMKENPLLSALLLGYKGATFGAQIGGKFGALIGAGAGAVAGVMPWVIEKVGGKKEEKVAEVAEKHFSIQQQLTEEQLKELNYWKEINRNFDTFNRDFDALIRSVSGAVAGGGVGAGAERKLTAEELEKLSKMREQQEWTFYTQWSRMAEMMAKAPETAGPRISPFYRYARGEISWEQMLAAERVERFQEEQVKKLEEMIRVAQETGTPNYGLMSKAYAEMFNIAYQRGDFGRAQEYMNLSLDALKEEMAKQSADMQKELGYLANIEANTKDMVEVVKITYGTPAGLRTTIYHAGREEGWSEDELRYQVRRALGEA